jgi:hypothetical protein
MPERYASANLFMSAGLPWPGLAPFWVAALTESLIVFYIFFSNFLDDCSTFSMDLLILSLTFSIL